MRIRNFPTVVRLACLLPFVAAIAWASDPGDPSDLKFVLLVTRHGVRSPLASQMDYSAYSAQPWPAWDVPAGHLTSHGRKQMTLMGEYYRSLYVRDGLLTGDATRDADLIYFRADSDERTIETARGLAAALVPGNAVTIHAAPNAQLDPMFRPAALMKDKLDRPLAIASVRGRVGGDARNVVEANAAAFLTLEKVLVGESAVVPPGKRDVRSERAAIGPGHDDHTVAITGPLQVAASMTDVFMLEYAEGMPLDQVGWGRLTPSRLTELLTLHSLLFELVQATSYPAQVQASNLASHILASLAQAATGRANPAAIGLPTDRLVIVVGHDTNIANLGGLLGLNWWQPGTHRNPVLLGGALVFELRERRRDHQQFVWVSYVSQSLDQMRTLTPLTPANPPDIAPIFVPGASESGPGFPVPLAAFAALVNRVIDPRFVVADPNPTVAATPSVAPGM